MRYIFAVLFLVLPGCATMVEVDYTPEQTCERECALQAECMGKDVPSCLRACSRALETTCGAERKALLDCTADTYALSRSCDQTTCRCGEQLAAFEECEGTAAK